MGLEARHAYRFGYLKSEHWQDLRIKKLVEADARCFFCGKRDLSNDVHHAHYPKNLFTTETRMLRVLCREHHARMHEIMEQKKELYKDRVFKNKEGRDFMIFRIASVQIENELRDSGRQQFSSNGRRRSQPTELKIPKVVDKKMLVIEKLNYCKGKLHGIASDADHFASLPLSFRKRYAIVQQTIVELRDMLLSPSQWAEEQNKKLLDSLGIKDE